MNAAVERPTAWSTEIFGHVMSAKPPVHVHVHDPRVSDHTLHAVNACTGTYYYF